MIVNNKSLEPIYHIFYRGTLEGVKNTSIEKYYDDFKDVRIVPYKEIRKKIKNPTDYIVNSLTYYKDSQHTIKKEKIMDDSFLNNPKGESKEYAYRTFLKMNWLICNIAKNGLREPITGVVFPEFTKENKLEYSLSVHPGSFRYRAFEIADLNPDCIIFDAYNVFDDHPKASLSDVLALFKDDNTQYEISMLPNNDNFMTPQILNTHPDSLNWAMTDNLKMWHNKNKHMWHEQINIFIGYDSSHADASNVCHNSILDSITTPFRNNIRIQHLDMVKIKEYTRPYENQNTEFAYTRFLVPYLSGYKGISIFVDDDFIFTDNILYTCLFLSHEHSVACVKHDFTKKYEKKFNNATDTWYDKKLWSSLMVFNNSHPDCKKLTPEVVNTVDGEYLHQFKWTKDKKIASLPKSWNWCEGYDDINNIHDAKGLHFTRGGSWIKGMDCSDIEGLEVYDAYRLRGKIDNDRSEFPRRFCSFLDIRKYYDVDSGKIIDGAHEKMCLQINQEN